jgi:hypothetical protein
VEKSGLPPLSSPVRAMTDPLAIVEDSRGVGAPRVGAGLAEAEAGEPLTRSSGQVCCLILGAVAAGLAGHRPALFQDGLSARISARISYLARSQERRSPRRQHRQPRAQRQGRP